MGEYGLEDFRAIIYDQNTYPACEGLWLKANQNV